MAVLDILTYGTCLFFICYSGEDESVFYKALRIIQGFAIFYAVSLWIQVLFPSVYDLFLLLQPEEVVISIENLQKNSLSYTGFSSNTGFTAGHICAGLICLLASFFPKRKVVKSIPSCVLMAFLFASLLLTGKRGHLLAIIIAAIVLYIFSVNGRTRLLRLRNAAILLVAMFAALLVFGRLFSFIPAIARIYNTVINLFSGDDVTSGRARLYAFAWDTFLRNPFWGMGWNQFKNATIGVVTGSTALEAHNIYLQTLSEIGIVGFVLVFAPVVYFLYTAIRNVNRILTLSETSLSPMLRTAVWFSLGYQVFFLIYGFTGNPLYDYNYMILYFFADTIGVVCARKLNYISEEACVAQNPKRAGILTFHFVYNQGAVLQCYALQHFLKKMGMDVSVIDYRPSYHAVRYTAWKNPFVLARYNWKKHSKKPILKRMKFALRGFARAVISDIRRSDRVIDRKFHRFTAAHLNLTRKYTSLRELRMTPPQMDAYISGSDQLWNPELLDFEFDPAYFMDFGPDSVKRITYAVSLKEKYSAEEKACLEKLCKNIDAVCIREQNEDLTRALGKEAAVCIDPSLLLTREDYRPLEAERKMEKPYVFVYGFETSSEINEAVQVISERYGLKVINGSPKRVKLSTDCVRISDYSPDDFLSYIRYADYVITNSFHGTAFSVIYRKDFVVVAHTTRGRRMTELLEKLGLSSRLWTDAGCAWDQEIDYRGPDEKLRAMQVQAARYLEEHLGS